MVSVIWFLKFPDLSKTITGKTDTPFKFSVKVNVPAASRNDAGYRFTIEKTSNESESSGVIDNIQSTGWFEIENAAQAYPRTAVIGYALGTAFPLFVLNVWTRLSTIFFDLPSKLE